MRSIGLVPETFAFRRRSGVFSCRVPIALPLRSASSDHAAAGGGVGLQRPERVEDDVVGQRVRPHTGEPRFLRVERLAHRDRVAGQRAVIVGAADEADLEAALEVEVPEPLEGAVAGGDLDQLLHLGVVARPVAGVVRVRNDEDVVGIDLGAQPLVEQVEVVRLLHADQVVIGRAEEDIVMPALASLRRPLVAEVGDEASFVVVLARQLLQAAPLPVVHQRVVLRHGEEVEPRVVAAEAVVVLGGALALGEPRVAVGLAPVEAPPLPARTQIGLLVPVTAPSSERTVNR